MRVPAGYGSADASHGSPTHRVRCGARVQDGTPNPFMPSANDQGKADRPERDDSAPPLLVTTNVVGSPSQRRALAVSALISSLALLWLSRPVASGLFLGTLLAFSLLRVHERLARHLRSSNLSAVLLALASALVMIGLGLALLLCRRARNSCRQQRSSWIRPRRPAAQRGHARGGGDARVSDRADRSRGATARCSGRDCSAVDPRGRHLGRPHAQRRADVVLYDHDHLLRASALDRDQRARGTHVAASPRAHARRTGGVRKSRKRGVHWHPTHGSRPRPVRGDRL